MDINLRTTNEIYDLLNLKQKKLFDTALNKIKPYCNEDGITSIIEGALKNVKKGCLISNENKKAKNRSIEIFINRLQLMTDYVVKVGKEIRIRPGIDFIESTGSDPHTDGQHALFIIRNNNTERKLYKPHSLKFENAFMGKKNSFLTFLNEKMTGSTEKLGTMNINPNTHTEEFIKRKGDKNNSISKEEFNSYMKKLGMLEIASYVFGITDLHCENIIFGENGPIAIDAECGGAFNTTTQIEDGDAPPVKTQEIYLANPSALYVDVNGDKVQQTDKGEEYKTGKEQMENVMINNKKDIIKESGELLKKIDKFRILPFTTSELAVSLDAYIRGYEFNEDLKKSYINDFYEFFNTHPLFKDNVILELDKFWIFFFDAIKKGTLPSFEFNLENQVILLDNQCVGHINPGIDIRQRILEQMEGRINNIQNKRIREIRKDGRSREDQQFDILMLRHK